MTFGERLRGRDADVFVGRLAERVVLAEFLDERSERRIAYVHGRAGIGKSSLLRDLSRDAEAGGFTVFTLDGRELPNDTTALDTALAALPATDRLLLVIDTYDDIVALGQHLRDTNLPALPDGARVVFASRLAPEAEWQGGVWGPSLIVLDLAELDESDSRALLTARGVEDPALADSLVAWADGLPLALSLGAAAGVARGAELDVAELDRTLLDHLTGGRMLGADRDVLALAALAPAVDARLLADVLPHVDAGETEAWLRGLSFSEPLGLRVTLHRHVRTVIQSDLRRYEPEYEGVLRLRIIDRLAERAAAGEPHLIGDMREVLEAPEDRGVALSDARKLFRADAVRPGDADEIEQAYGYAAQPLRTWLRGWIERSPAHVIPIRDSAGVAGVAVWATPQQHPGWTDDPILGPALADAATYAPDGNVLLQIASSIWRPAEQMPAVVSVGYVSLIVRCGLPNLRWWQVVVRADDEASKGRLAAFGAVRSPGFAVRLGGVDLHAYVMDFGPGGIISMTRDRAHAVYGFAHQVRDGRADLMSTEVVRDLLRCFHQPTALAASPLATGAGAPERAESVRRLLRVAIDEAFGQSTSELALRLALEIGYLEPDGGHGRAMHRLHLSRTTYFRRLRDATDRLAAHLQGVTV